MGKPSRTTMAKRNRERALQEKRQEKMARKQQRRMDKSNGLTSEDSDFNEAMRDESVRADNSFTDHRTFENGS